MINLIIPLKSRKTTLKEIFEVVKNSSFKDEIFVRILCEKNNPILQEKTKTKIPFSIDVFDTKTSEDGMLFEIIKNLEKDELVIVRNGCKFFSAGALNKLIKNGKNKKDIVFFCKKNTKKNKIKLFFQNFFKKVCNLFFNFTFFEGDLGLMYFSPRAHNILQETNVTAMTKINRWAGVEIGYIEDEISTSKICEKVPKNIPIKLGIYLAVLIGIIVGTIFLGKSGNLSMLLIILFVCLVTSLLILSLYMVLKWVCFRKIGEIYSPKTTILERRFE